MRYTQQLIEPPYTEHPNKRTREAPEEVQEWEKKLLAEPGYHWVPITTGEMPIPGVNQKIEPTWQNLENSKYLSYDLAALSTEELEDRDQREAARKAYQALRDGTGTQAERLARVERTLAYLLKQAFN